MTHLEFIFRGFAKDTVYREKLQNVNELRDKIIRAAERINI
jgi:hypothetical protein